MAHGLTGSPQVDIAVITAIPPELIAVRDALGIPEDARIQDDAGTIAYRGRIHSALARRDYEVVLTCMGHQGNAGSASFAGAVIARYRPQAVLLVGIAAGRRGKVRIGDVVLSERVVAYEPAAIVGTAEGGSREEPQTDSRPIPHLMRQAVAHYYKPPDERLRARFKKGGVTPPPPAGNETLYQEHVATWPNVKVATIASGEKLLRDSARMDSIFSLHRKIEAVEKEAVGVMEACEQNAIPWLVIRGISDFGDELKDDRFHEFASRAAAAVLADFLEQGLELKKKRRGSLAMAAGIALLLVAGGGLYAGIPRQADGDVAVRCGDDLGPSPFKNPEATHFLVADFFGAPSTEANFSRTVSAQVTQALATFKEEVLRSPKEIDLEVPEGSLEIERLSCFVENHEQAEAIAKELKADIVIWGQAFCNPGDLRNVDGQGGKAYTVCPKATLYRAGHSFRQGIEHGLDLASLGHIDLPALRSTEPFLLIQYALGLHFYEKENFWLAARFFEKSAEHVIKNERDEAPIDVALGFVYLQWPKLDLSLHYSEKALQSLRGSGSELEAHAVSNIGGVYLAQGRYADAFKYQSQALAIIEKLCGKEHPTTAILLNNAGLALYRQGDTVKALEYYRRAQSIAEKAYGEDDLNVLMILNNIGTALHAQRDYVGSMRHLQRALGISERVLGESHPEVARVLGNIGGVLSAQGDKAGALTHYRRALEIEERTLGKEHPEVAIQWNNIGGVLESQGDYAGALEHYRRSLAITEKVLGRDGDRTEILLGNLGRVLEAQQDYVGALEHFQRALDVAEKKFGKDHHVVAFYLSCVAGVLFRQRDYAGALERYRRALAIEERESGFGHSHLDGYLVNIGAVLYAQEKYKEALDYFRRAAAVREAELGRAHPNVRQLYWVVALVIARQSGNFDDAKMTGAVVVRCVGVDCSGLLPGDVVVAYGRVEVRDALQLHALSRAMPRDRLIVLSVMRGGKKIFLPTHGGVIMAETVGSHVLENVFGQKTTP